MRATWTAESIPDLPSKVAIVTGANSGIGYETKRALASKRASVVLACRNEEKGAAAVRAIVRDKTGARALLLPLDLADPASVRRFVQSFVSAHDRLDILVNNAGVMATPREKTADGLELQFGTNHLGHFALPPIAQLRGEGFPIQEEDVARPSPLLHEHINMLGRYSFAVPEAVVRGELRPLRDPLAEQ